MWQACCLLAIAKSLDFPTLTFERLTYRRQEPLLSASASFLPSSVKVSWYKRILVPYSSTLMLMMCRSCTSVELLARYSRTAAVRRLLQKDRPLCHRTSPGRRDTVVVLGMRCWMIGRCLFECLYERCRLSSSELVNMIFQPSPS
jgi:hypothetical protein